MPKSALSVMAALLFSALLWSLVALVWNECAFERPLTQREWEEKLRKAGHPAYQKWERIPRPVAYP
jgi:hypothetical protein